MNARAGWSPDYARVAAVGGKTCASVTRTGRHQQSTDRRDPVAQEARCVPGVLTRRQHTGDGRPLTADAVPDPVRRSVLRC
ncbi:hypothetical protein [Micromonospora sp. NPDC092111]|uniref:hypothetical protein n=1 Tax=Micromonospora sp. NPDC092111 TaxID=3364289 RepID=UPI0038149BE1